MTDWVELARRKYAAYLVPAYLNDPTFLAYVNSTLDPTGTVGSIIPEFVQSLPALQQSAIAADVNRAGATQNLQALQQLVTAAGSDRAEVTQILAGIVQTATATVI